MKKNSTFLKLFGAAANGKNDEELSRLAMDAADALEEISEKAESKVEEEVKDACGSKDADPIAELNAKFDKLLELLMPKTEEKVEEKVEEKTELDEAIEKLEGEEKVEEKLTDAEEAAVVPAEEMDEDPEKAIDSAISAHILKSVRSAVAGIQDAKSRKAVSDALIAAVSVKTNDIKKVMDASVSHAAKVQMTTNEAIQNAYDRMNPHKKEVK